jgi:hypothetical protein
MDTRTPAARAARMASRQASAEVRDRAGVMPVKWNQSAPWKISAQGKSPGRMRDAALAARS